MGDIKQYLIVFDARLSGLGESGDVAIPKGRITHEDVSRWSNEIKALQHERQVFTGTPELKVHHGDPIDMESVIVTINENWYDKIRGTDLWHTYIAWLTEYS